VPSGQGGTIGFGMTTPTPPVPASVSGLGPGSDHNSPSRLQCEYCRRDCTAFIDVLHREVGHAVCKADHVLCVECWRKHIQRFRQSECGHGLCCVVYDVAEW
jgi:hypothetical protein